MSIGRMLYRDLGPLRGVDRTWNLPEVSRVTVEAIDHWLAFSAAGIIF